MRWYSLIQLLLILGFNSCCRYIPFVDAQIINDFNRKRYTCDNADAAWIATDSANIAIRAETLIPCRCKSKNLKIFFASMQLDINKNLFRDSLVIPLKPGQVTCSDGKSTIEGKPNIVNTSSSCFLVIAKQHYYLMQYNVRIDGVLFKFDYSGIKEFDFNNQILKINLGDIVLPDGKIIPSKEIICRFKA
jgi:hypothetical protein